MNLTALHRPHQLGRITTQLNYGRRSPHQPPSVRSAARAGRLVGRWTMTPDGLTFTWAREHSRRASEEVMSDQDEGRSPRPGAHTHRGARLS